MKVYLNITGGPIPYGVSGQVDMEDLPADLADRAQSSLQNDYMDKAISSDRELPLPDEQVYEIVVTDPSGKKNQLRYKFADSQASAELLDLLDELRLAITDQQIEQVEAHTTESESVAPEEAKSSRTRPPRRR